MMLSFASSFLKMVVLVWFGNDGGYTQEYTSKYISYKLGTYLAAGLPVIIPRGISK